MTPAAHRQGRFDSATEARCSLRLQVEDNKGVVSKAMATQDPDYQPFLKRLHERMQKCASARRAPDCGSTAAASALLVPLVVRPLEAWRCRPPEMLAEAGPTALRKTCKLQPPFRL